MKRIIQYIFGTLVTASSVTTAVFAEQSNRNNESTYTGGVQVVQLKNPISANSVDQLLGNIIDILLLLAAPVLVCVFIWIGLQFVLAQGNATKLQQVRSTFLWTIVGAAIVIGAKGIQLLVTGTFEAII